MKAARPNVSTIKAHAADGECELCVNGFTVDSMSRDHFGHVTRETTDCMNGVRPCRSHQCYVLMDAPGK